MLEQKPVQAVVFPPKDGDRYKVKTGDSWESVARANSLDAWALIEFNFRFFSEECGCG
jgi:LysM repeat protein